MTLKQFLCLGILFGNAVIENDGTLQGIWRGTIVVAISTGSEAVLAADTLETRKIGSKVDYRTVCKVFPLTKESAVATVGMELPKVIASLRAQASKKDETLEATSKRWTTLFDSTIHRANYLPTDEEFKHEIESGVFVKVTPQKVEILNKSLQPFGKPGQYVLNASEHQSIISLDHMSIYAAGMQEPLGDWMQASTALGWKERDYIKSLWTATLKSKELDNMAREFLNGAIDADKRNPTKYYPGYQGIGGQLEILHFNRLTGKMFWVDNPVGCPNIPWS